MNDAQRIIYENWRLDVVPVVRRLIEIVGEDNKNAWYGNIHGVDAKANALLSACHRAIKANDSASALAEMVG